MTERQSGIDKRAVRRSFDRAAVSYDAAAVLQQEVCRRHLERLDVVRQQPDCIVDIGCGTGSAWPGLQARYPRALMLALDLAPGMLAQARAGQSWWRRLSRRMPRAICGDMERLPICAGTADLVWSNLALQWAEDSSRAFAEARRVLRPGGLYSFTTFGPDTLSELRAAQSTADHYTHVSEFSDMHDLGDSLLAAGFAEPVMDVERFTLTYTDVVALMRDLKAIGARNATASRPRGLSGRAWLQAVGRGYEPFRVNGRLPATYEVVYGHAWVPEPKTGPGGRRVIDIKPVQA
jgi:malonyl-CoA O-methyltransferase